VSSRDCQEPSRGSLIALEAEDLVADPAAERPDCLGLGVAAPAGTMAGQVAVQAQDLVDRTRARGRGAGMIIE
jgi:hypothetical protein